MKPGDRYKVKATPITRKYGVHTYGAWQSKHDNRVWPGEIGTVVLRTWTAHDGSPMSGHWLEFERGRSISEGSFDPADFVKVRIPRTDSKSIGKDRT